MNSGAYLDLLRSNIDVVKENVAWAIEIFEDENNRLNDRVFTVEKENMRLQTENRMMREENNHLKAEVIKLLDTIGKSKNDLEDDCIGCEFGKCECTAGCDPDEPCCQEKAMESGN